MAGNSNYIPYGATPVYIPKGASPVTASANPKPVSSLPIIGPIANFIAPQTTKTLDMTIGAYPAAQQTLNDPNLTSEQKAQWAQDYAKGLTKSTLQGQTERLASFPATGENWLARAGIGALRGSLYGSSQDNATPASVAESAAFGSGAEVLLPPIAKKIGDVVGTAKDIVMNPTMKSAGKNVGRAAEKATQEGASISWDKPTPEALAKGEDDSLMGQITAQVKKRMTWNKEVRNATNDLLSNLTPVPDTIPGTPTTGAPAIPTTPSETTTERVTGLIKKGGKFLPKIESTPTSVSEGPLFQPSTSATSLPQMGESNYTANNLLQTRSQLTQTTGQKIFKAMAGKGGTVEDKVASIARTVITKNLHQVAPETLTPDKVLAIYHSLPLGRMGVLGLVADTVGLGKAVEWASKIPGLLNPQ